MPKAWSEKRERQYEHVKESAKKQGRSMGTAKRIAAATVNKTRADQGETAASRRAPPGTSARTTRSAAKGRGTTTGRTTRGGTKTRGRRK